jgi:hypothetical protein
MTEICAICRVFHQEPCSVSCTLRTLGRWRFSWKVLQSIIKDHKVWWISMNIHEYLWISMNIHKSWVLRCFSQLFFSQFLVTCLLIVLDFLITLPYYGIFCYNMIICVSGISGYMRIYPNFLNRQVSGAFCFIPDSHVKCPSRISSTLQKEAHGVRRSHTCADCMVGKLL